MRGCAEVPIAPPVLRIAIIGIAAAVLAGGHAMAQPLRIDEGQRSRRVHAGEIRRIAYFWGLNPDCSVQRGFNVRVERKPLHGDVWLEKTTEQVDPRWAERAGTRRASRNASQCLGVEVPVIAVFYRAKAGYAGPDDLLVIKTTPSGLAEIRREFQMSVE